MELIEARNVPMTQEIWEHCLGVCIQDGNVAQFNRLWTEYPDFAARMMQEFDDVVSRSDAHVTKEETLASWERMIREEYGRILFKGSVCAGPVRQKP